MCLSRILCHASLLLSMTLLFACGSENTTSTTSKKTTEPATTEANTSESPGLEGFEIQDFGEGYQWAVKRNPGFLKSDSIEEEGMVKNGKREGTWIKYDNKYGSPGSVTPYLNGKVHGTMVTMDSRSSISGRTNYVNGVLHGRYATYTELRKIMEKGNYKNGKLHGTKSTFYPSGGIRQTTDYLEGVRNGFDTYYRQDSTISIRYTYKDGERTNEEKELGKLK